MPEPDETRSRVTLIVGFVAGVSPDKWARVWAERMPHVELRLRPVAADAAVASLRAGNEMVFARLPLPPRDPTTGDQTSGDEASELHSIPLWEETPVVIAPKDHPVKLFDAVTLADLESENMLEGEDDATLDLVAAGVGLARMPQAVFRANGRRDVIARPISDAEPTRIALVWPAGATDEVLDEFIGVVRGRTVQSSRGAAPEPAKAQPKKGSSPQKSGKTGGKVQKGRPAKGRGQVNRGASRRGR
ncbi:LysR family transcriptional regulator substrate-binding protein [Herbiconiux sp. L3-i23]|uniref:LysR family transcriptional regulator substrate-binding protein n=1 Tax=Herbiconiux sp. L3-i23 TaxID=2905871 RepID=UPI00205CB621|nr:LysR family transcriptional regulator substrate-binding protein [Herbiconiux sp. L3-i23]BDI22144.1 LysR family transcriptional regulator [Herbiconiux sp. L3-i23]